MRNAALAAVLTVGTLLSASCTKSKPAPPPPAPIVNRTASLTPGPGDWTTFGHDTARTGKAEAPQLRPNPQPGRSVPLDGPVYGQPLIVGDTILAATENDSVYAVSALDGSLIWRSHLAEPFHPQTCGNIQPLGVTGTPVYDPDTHLLYVVTEDSAAHHVLVALNAATGEVVQRTTVDPPTGNRTDSQQRPALALLNGHVYAAFGGLFGDCGTYTGSVASVDAASGQVAWYSASTSGRGGIWAPGGAPVAGNRLYFSVGNGNAGGSAAWDGTDSVVALASDSPGPQPKRADIFAPSRWAADNAADADLGSMNPALVDGHVLIAGKAGLGYVLDANHLGGVTAQPTAFDHCHGFGAAAVDGDVAYVPCAGGIAAVRVGSDGSASVRWRATVAAVGSPSIGGGCIWSADWSNGILYALDPATGKTAGQVKTGALPHFASPSISGSRLVLGTLDGIEIFSF